jgi:hypothetical protein
MFCESYECLKTLYQIWFFGHISFVWAFLDLQLFYLIDHKGFYMWEKFQVIWICIERDPSILSFSLSFEVNFFWKWLLFVVVINRPEILKRYRKHISNVSLKISRILKLLIARPKSFCVHVPVWGDFKEVARSFILWS